MSNAKQVNWDERLYYQLLSATCLASDNNRQSNRQTEMFDYMTQKDVWRNIKII